MEWEDAQNETAFENHKQLTHTVKTLQDEVRLLKSEMSCLKKLAIIGIFGNKQKLSLIHI